VNWVPLSVMMEFGTPKRWMMLVKNATACSDLMLFRGRYGLQSLNGQVGLPCVELTPFAGADNSSGVGHCCRPVETLSEGVSNKGSRCCVMAANPRVYLL
jgi:hypothetical protein